VKVQTVEFVARVRKLQDLPKERLPQIAVAGRSNVGKSSLLNQVVVRKKLAPTSGTPGKTKTLDFFRINNKYFLVDLPGFGYARKPGAVRENWKQLIEEYLTQGELVCGLLHLVDIRRGFMETDIQLSEWLRELEIPEIIVATKCDKVSRNHLNRDLKSIERSAAGAPVVPFTIRDRTPVSLLLKAIDELLCTG
jgi:GTP-binding protein